MYKRIVFGLFTSLLFVSCGDDNAKAPVIEHDSAPYNSELLCNNSNEGAIFKPADSEESLICKNGSWIAVEQSSEKEVSSSSSSESGSSEKEVSSSSSSESGSSEKEVSSSSSSESGSSEKEVSSSSSSESGSSEKEVSSSSSSESGSSEKEVSSSSSSESGSSEKEVSSSSSSESGSSEKEVSSSSSSESGSSEKEVSSSSSSESGSSEKEVSSSSSSEKSSSSEEKSSSSIEQVSGICNINNSDNCEYGILTDERDGQIYKTVKIGEQWWMAQNLNYPTTQSYCYGGKEENCQKYGRLYEFSDAKDACPEGWKLPTYTPDWVKLKSFVNKTIGTSENIGKTLRSSSEWDETGTGKGLNYFGFNALPAGKLKGASYLYEGTAAYFWENKISADSGAFFAKISYTLNEDSLDFILGHNILNLYINHESNVAGSKFKSTVANSVRCIKE